MFDGEPVGMWRALTDDDVAEADDDLDLDPAPRFATLAELNDLAYGTGRLVRARDRGRRRRTAAPVRGPRRTASRSPAC